MFQYMIRHCNYIYIIVSYLGVEGMGMVFERHEITDKNMLSSPLPI
jgi:hypothetical protein